MTRIASLAVLASLACTSAHAGDAEITLKFATVAPMAASLYDADPDGGWIATPAEPAAAKTKADILIESLGNASLEGGISITYEPSKLHEDAYATSTDGTIAVHKVNDVTLKRGVVGATVEGERGRELASIVSPATTTWEDLAFDAEGYLVVDAVGDVWFVFPPNDWGLIGLEPDEIDVR